MLRSILCIVLFSSLGLGADAKLGLYVGKGTWDDGKTHLRMFFDEYGYSVRTFTAKSILEGELKASGVRLLVVPGGESIEYLKELGEKGATRILEFVEEGGNYIGICAGAFYATSDRLGGNATGKYGIGLLHGVAYDGTALHTPPFIEGMMDLDFLPHFLTGGLKSHYKIIMFGGPSFRYSADEEREKNIRVMSRYVGFDEPAMITFDYYQGHVFLSGPHLEIEEDRTNWGYKDPDSEWPILERIVDAFTDPSHS